MTLSPRETADRFRPHWLYVWRRILCDWLEWPEHRFDSWVRCFQSQLDGDDVSMSMWLYHDHVLRSISQLFIPDDVADRLKYDHSDDNYPHGLHALRDRIEDAATFTSDRIYCDDPDYDWDAAKDRVSYVLSSYGVPFPDSRLQTNYEFVVRQHAAE